MAKFGLPSMDFSVIFKALGVDPVVIMERFDFAMKRLDGSLTFFTGKFETLERKTDAVLDEVKTLVRTVEANTLAIEEIQDRLDPDKARPSGKIMRGADLEEEDAMHIAAGHIGAVRDDGSVDWGDQALPSFNADGKMIATPTPKEGIDYAKSAQQ